VSSGSFLLLLFPPYNTQSSEIELSCHEAKQGILSLALGIPENNGFSLKNNTEMRLHGL